MDEFEDWARDPAPSPWERAGNLFDQNLSLLVRGVFLYREQILAYHPWVKLPSGDPQITMPIAALILAWERWNYLQGECPDCAALALGVSFGGMLSKGQVTGVCTKCALVVKRFIGGGGRAATGAQKCVQCTPYGFKTGNGMWYNWHFQGIPSDVVTMLHELGVVDLPTPTVGLST